MLLRDYLKNGKIKQDIALLFFEGDELECKEYSYKNFKNIPKEYLTSEVMDTKDEEDCLEIWI